MRSTITFRDQGAADEAIVRHAHITHRAELLKGIGWPADALARLCVQQHLLQERHIAIRHPDAEMRMIVALGRPVGRLCLDRSGTGPWRIVDLVLLPDVQGRGVGTAALRAVLLEARRVGAVVELQVGHDNPRAEALYRREGFVDAFGASDTHRRLIRSPGPLGPDRRDGSTAPVGIRHQAGAREEAR